MKNIRNPSEFKELNQIKEKHITQLNAFEDLFFSNEKCHQKLLQSLSFEVDQLIKENIQLDKICIIALGGYGREEIFPFSDIDLLVIINNQTNIEQLAKNFSFLWTINRKINISYRTLDEIRIDCQIDLVFFTSLLDARFIAGDLNLFKHLKNFLKTKPIKKQIFLNFLMQHENEREKNITTNLEPDLKESPGNLRSYQSIFWALRYFDALDLVNENQKEILDTAYFILSRLRFGLHLISHKNNNELSFDLQSALRQKFKFSDIQIMMTPYYHSVLEIEFYFLYFTSKLKESLKHDKEIKNNRKNLESKNFNDLLTYLLNHAKKDIPYQLNNDFFQLLESLKLKKNTLKLNNSLKSQFLTLFYYPKTLSKQLMILHKAKLLQLFVPQVSYITGFQQYDLFHKFTVDRHILNVINEACFLLNGQFSKTMIDATHIAQSMIKPHLLLIACLFHDIAKGLNGNHDLLGSEMLDKYLIDIKLITADEKKILNFLVKEHLSLSLTVQKKDISNPDVIDQFAYEVNHIEQLNYLYLLTIADIRGTNINLWSTWRLSLLTSLYLKTKLALNEVNSQSNDLLEITSQEENPTLRIINRFKNKYDDEKLQKFLSLWGESYLNHFSSGSIKWHLDCLIEQLESKKTLLFSRFNQRIKQMELICFIPTKHLIFGLIADMATRLSLSILDARIYTSPKGQIFSQYVIGHIHRNQSLNDAFLLNKITETIKKEIQTYQTYQAVNFRKRQIKHYILEKKPTILIQKTDNMQLIIEIQTIDYPGLLADIIAVFDQFKLYITHAKINTLDFKVRDIFYSSFPKNFKEEDFCQALMQEIKVS